MKVPVMVALDEKSLKVWKKLPDQKKSATVRKLLLSLNEDEDSHNPKDQVSKSLCESSSGSMATRKLSRKEDVNLSEMAQVIRSGRKSLSKKPTENIQRALHRVLK